jgi:hemoglobin-like flavoprotein
MNLKSDILKDSIDLFVELFYDHFFEQTFEIAHLFRNTEIGKQKKEFRDSILTILEHEDNIEELNSYFEDMGVRHICYEVTNRHYSMAKTSFLYALEKTYASAWSVELNKSWNEVIDYIASYMINGAKKVELAS